MKIRWILAVVALTACAEPVDGLQDAGTVDAAHGSGEGENGGEADSGVGEDLIPALPVDAGPPPVRIEDLEVTAGQCRDGEDNDQDGEVDCDDLDCEGYVFCLYPGADFEYDAGLDAGECILGDYRIENHLDIIALQPYACVTGDLEIRVSGIPDLHLPGVVYVGGTLLVQSTDLVDLDGLSEFTSVGAVVISGNSSLGDIGGLYGIGDVDFYQVQNNPKLICDEAELLDQWGDAGIICQNGPDGGCGPSSCL